MTIVEQLVNRNTVAVHVDQPLVEAARRMRDAGVGALLVLDGDELVGVVTDRDLVCAVSRTPSTRSRSRSSTS